MYHSFALAVSAIALSASLLAQGPSLTTQTDYGALASLNGTDDFASIDSGTTNSRALGVRASVRTGFMGPFASAASSARLGFSWFGASANISESGAIFNDDPNGSASVGTSDSNQSSTSPTRGSHTVRVTFPAAMGANGEVTLNWFGHASMNASASVDVDVDGDGMPDFSATANGMRAQQRLTVTAGANGVEVDVTTTGAADVTGSGREQYFGSLDVSFRQTPTPRNCVITSFGNGCGPTLAGAVQSGFFGDIVAFTVSGGQADAFAFLAMGTQSGTPNPIPGTGGCQLLVDVVNAAGFRLDANGDGRYGVRLPRTGAFNLDFQVLTLSFGASGIVIEATNGLNVTCQ